MHWEWLVPVIFLIVWIVSSLIQGAERERSRINRPRSLPGSDRPPGEGAARRPATDIDRFLEEVNRRRRQAAERKPTGRDKPPVAAVGRVTAAARPRVSTRSASGRPAVPVQPVPSRSGKILEAIPVTGRTAAAAEILAVASALHAAPAQSFPQADTPSPASRNSVAVDNALSALPPLAELLRAPDNLATAVILHEIFSPPRSLRRGIR